MPAIPMGAYVNAQPCRCDEKLRVEPLLKLRSRLTRAPCTSGSFCSHWGLALCDCASWLASLVFFCPATIDARRCCTAANTPLCPCCAVRQAPLTAGGRGEAAVGTFRPPKEAPPACLGQGPGGGCHRRRLNQAAMMVAHTPRRTCTQMTCKRPCLSCARRRSTLQSQRQASLPALRRTCSWSPLKLTTQTSRRWTQLTRCRPNSWVPLAAWGITCLLLSARSSGTTFGSVPPSLASSSWRASLLACRLTPFPTRRSPLR